MVEYQNDGGAIRGLDRSWPEESVSAAWIERLRGGCSALTVQASCEAFRVGESTTATYARWSGGCGRGLLLSV